MEVCEGQQYDVDFETREEVRYPISENDRIQNSCIGRSIYENGSHYCRG